MSIHLHVLAHLKEKLKDHPFGKTINDENTDDVNLKILFKNVRLNNNKKTMGKEKYLGLRLTDLGLQILKVCFECWEIRVTEDWRIRSKHIVFFDRHCNFPFHVDKNFITFFDSEHAFILKLFSDFDRYMKQEINSNNKLLTKRR